MQRNILLVVLMIIMPGCSFVRQCLKDPDIRGAVEKTEEIALEEAFEVVGEDARVVVEISPFHKCYQCPIHCPAK